MDRRPQDNVKRTLVDHGVPEKEADVLAELIVRRLRNDGWSVSGIYFDRED